MNNFDALALEYQRDYGNSRNYFDTSDFVNETFVEGVGSVLSLGFSEKFLNFPLCDIGVFSGDATDLEFHSHVLF